MDNTCADCEYLKTKDTKKSKLPYGYCKLLKLNMIAVQVECGFYKKQVIEKGTA